MESMSTSSIPFCDQWWINTELGLTKKDKNK